MMFDDSIHRSVVKYKHQKWLYEVFHSVKMEASWMETKWSKLMVFFIDKHSRHCSVLTELPDVCQRLTLPFCERCVLCWFLFAMGWDCQPNRLNNHDRILEHFSCVSGWNTQTSCRQGRRPGPGQLPGELPTLPDDPERGPGDGSVTWTQKPFSSKFFWGFVFLWFSSFSTEPNLLECKRTRSSLLSMAKTDGLFFVVLVCFLCFNWWETSRLDESGFWLPENTRRTLCLELSQTKRPLDTKTNSN